MEAIQTKERPETVRERTAGIRTVPEKETSQPSTSETSFSSDFKELRLTEHEVSPMTPSRGPHQGPAQMSKPRWQTGPKPRKYGYYGSAVPELGEGFIPRTSHGRNTRNLFEKQFKELADPRPAPATQADSRPAPATQADPGGLMKEELDRQRQMLAVRIAQRNLKRGVQAPEPEAAIPEAATPEVMAPEAAAPEEVYDADAMWKEERRRQRRLRKARLAQNGLQQGIVPET